MICSICKVYIQPPKAWWFRINKVCYSLSQGLAIRSNGFKVIRYSTCKSSLAMAVCFDNMV
jgi:hypothetical protein